MNALGVLLISVISLVAGYWLYARSIDHSVIRPDEKKATPAKMYMDGVDFTPANRNVLFGYQFKSIAALGPILGPIIAVQWGWLPALAWIILGTVFIGWVQDYSSIVLGVREEGQSFGALSYRLISPRSRGILITFIYFYLWLIMGSFGVQVGFSLFTNPAVPIGVLLVILVGLDEEIRLHRLTTLRGLDEADARARIASQATDEQRRAVADVWLDNSGTPEQLAAAATAVWEQRLVPLEANVRLGRIAEPGSVTVDQLGYVVELPGGVVARCNPVTAPPDCDDDRLAESTAD